ncbi:MAG: FGGY-family carbohydrate kinase [Bauldia sp.]|uniref:FGGY-family carbohydrate kinase n=1 Tax=Bauldia sp. TaxID=2575872 RepID=UPI001D97B9E7|nr:FGGY-family carbohydrate kinase [Bauldia sp.]MCB1494496.1 FGGY-family carbohydrate kinase [Bauldia sp.]
MEKAFVGIDVGTGSARAGIFTADGRLLGTARRNIEMWREAGDVVEQSSDDIWAACGTATKQAVAEAGIPAEAVAGIAFDATCSLVALDPDGGPISVSPSGEARRNVIVWMDHRAMDETRAINATGHPVLRYVGGGVSPEMEMPKLLWLKRHLPATFEGAGQFFDLVDFLTFRATGDAARSICTVTCKWNYLAHERGWNEDYLAAIGMPEFAAEGYARIGTAMVAPGAPVGGGLSAAAARDLGLLPGTPVAAGLIDAHAGGVGTLGGTTIEGDAAEPAGRLAYIMGTSACIMASTVEARFVPGVWGPYWSAMLPERWLIEGGQSTAGAGIDHLIRSHAAYPEARAEAERAGLGVHDWLDREIVEGRNSFSEAALIARDIHILPDYLGNRSPYADPHARAVMAGLSLDETVADLRRQYVAGLCGLSCGFADVIDALGEQGIDCRTIVVSGGASRSALVRQILADATSVRVVLPATGEPVLLGAAMLAAVAAGQFADLAGAMRAMSRDAEATAPTPPEIARFHEAKRDVYAAMRRLDIDARRRMAEVPESPSGSPSAS